MNPTTKTLPDRLISGARMLGNLWRSKHRCVRGWDLVEGDFSGDPCECPKKSEFCRARILWLTLAFENGQEVEIEPWGLAWAMTAEQWDATGLIFTTKSEKAGLIHMGSRSTISAVYLKKLSKDPESAVSIIALANEFPKARVEGIFEAGEDIP